MSKRILLLVNFFVGMFLCVFPLWVWCVVGFPQCAHEKFGTVSYQKDGSPYIQNILLRVYKERDEIRLLHHTDTYISYKKETLTAKKVYICNQPSPEKGKLLPILQWVKSSRQAENLPLLLVMQSLIRWGKKGRQIKCIFAISRVPMNGKDCLYNEWRLCGRRKSFPLLLVRQSFFRWRKNGRQRKCIFALSRVPTNGKDCLYNESTMSDSR
jgi:hypothetical protein